MLVLVQNFFTGATGKKMDYDQFTHFSKQAPNCVNWLTDLGKKLERQFRPGSHLIGMNFEAFNLQIHAEATEVSQRRIKNLYRECTGDKMMTADTFARCMEKLSVHNRYFSDRLFHLADVNSNKSLSEEEFTAWATKLATSAPSERCELAFQVIDRHNNGYLDRKTVRKYFQSWFRKSLHEVDDMTRLLDEWINGRVLRTDSSRLSGNREGGLSATQFVGSERMNNLDIAVNIQKKCTGEVGLLTDQITALAFEYAEKSNPSQGVHLYAPEFHKFIMEKTKFVSWLGTLCKPWMVTPEQCILDEQLSVSKVGPSPRLPIRLATRSNRSVPNSELLASVIDVGDVGKTLGSILQTARTGEPDLVMWNSSHRTSTGPGSMWWHRAFSTRVRPELALYRPPTCFDSISAVDVHRSFLQQVRERATHNRASFRRQLRQELGLHNACVVDFLYEVFDVNDDGMLEVEEATIGLLLLAQGTATERRQLSFSCFDAANQGLIARHDMHTWLRSLFRIGVAGLRGWLTRLTELFGERVMTPAEDRDAINFTPAVMKIAHPRLQRIVARMATIAFAADIDHDGVVSREEFELFATENPQFVKWSKHLGAICLHVVHSIENQRNSAKKLDHHVGQVPPLSVLWNRHKFSSGTRWDRLRVHHVRDIFASFSVYGKLGPEQFAALMRQFHVVSPYTVRRLFAVFDRDSGGDVTMREVGAGFCMLCGGGQQEKLTSAIQLFDEQDKGTMMFLC